MWFHGLTQLEAAQVVEATERTVQRRWVHARLKLHRALAVSCQDCKALVHATSRRTHNGKR